MVVANTEYEQGNDRQTWQYIIKQKAPNSYKMYKKTTFTPNYTRLLTSNCEQAHAIPL